jgi:hypothetical protein
MSCVLKWPVNPITNQKPVYGHTITWQLISEVELSSVNDWAEEIVSLYRHTMEIEQMM